MFLNEGRCISLLPLQAEGCHHFSLYLLDCSHSESLRAAEQVKEFMCFRAQYQAGEEGKVLDVTPDAWAELGTGRQKRTVKSNPASLRGDQGMWTRVRSWGWYWPGGSWAWAVQGASLMLWGPQGDDTPFRSLCPKSTHFPLNARTGICPWQTCYFILLPWDSMDKDCPLI